ncbi:MAG: hypothetical protein HRT56_09265 [Coraliomargarita sp.]|nr:hypothetical protein [Coraliomargarita sp.]
MERVLEPELLDQLDPADPDAVRSRRDLVWINWLMATERWMLSQLNVVPDPVDTVVELGAGEGRLLSKVHQRFPAVRCIGYDLVRRPIGLPNEIEWVSGDFFGNLDSMPLGKGTVVLANLILHHFDTEEVVQLKDAFASVGTLLLVEPDRSCVSLSLGWLLLPFVGRVTRFDMMTSIRAGFAKGELERVFEKNCVRENVWLGGRRLHLR